MERKYLVAIAAIIAALTIMAVAGLIGLGFTPNKGGRSAQPSTSPVEVGLGPKPPAATETTTAEPVPLLLLDETPVPAIEVTVAEPGPVEPVPEEVLPVEPPVELPVEPPVAVPEPPANPPITVTPELPLPPPLDAPVPPVVVPVPPVDTEPTRGLVGGAVGLVGGVVGGLL